MSLSRRSGAVGGRYSSSRALRKLIQQLVAVRVEDEAYKSTAEDVHGDVPFVPLEIQNQDTASLVYTKLTTSEIRLIHILPGERDDRICCSVFNVEQAATPPYEALSYLWGPQVNPETITLNNQPWKITRSLASALYALRQPSTSKTIWVDALAINQSDLHERSVQVAKMRAIYMFARSTTLWLGSGLAEMETLLDIIHLTTTAKGFNDRWTMCWEAPSASHIFDALCTMAKLRYWDRAWVVQEIMFSRKVLVQYGSKRLDYDRLLNFWMAFITTLEISGWKAENESDYQQSYSATLLEASGPAALPLPNSAQDCSFFNVEQWLDYTDLKEASDPRDHVFAYYGCLHPTIRRRLEIDYAKTPAQVNTQMTWLALNVLKHNPLDVILRAEQSIREPSQPSWVPSFGRDDESRFRAGLVTKLVKKYKVNAGNTGTRLALSMPSGNVLVAKGVQIGVVQQIAQPLIEETAYFNINDWFADENVTQKIMDSFSQSWELIRCPLRQDRPQSFIHSYLVNPVKSLEMLAILENFLLKESKDQQEALGCLQSILFTGYHIGRRMFSYSCTQPGNPIDAGREEDIITLYGLGPKEMIPGDKLCVLFGCSVPVILRQVDSKHCIFVGGASVHGFMYGEAVKDIDHGKRNVEEFWLE